jgi:hypothetical protein
MNVQIECSDGRNRACAAAFAHEADAAERVRGFLWLSFVFVGAC